MDVFRNIDIVYQLVTLLAIVGILISTAENLYNWRSYQDTRLYSWKVISTRVLMTKNQLLRHAIGFLLRYPNYLFVLFIRIVAIIMILVPMTPHSTTPFLFLLIIITTLLVNLRSPYGQDGADQMSSILMIVLFIHSIFPTDLVISQAGLWFIALQAILSYLTAGIAKIRGEKWTKRGDAVYLIFNTSSYGSQIVANFLRSRMWIAKLLTWSTVAVEVGFPLVLVMGNLGFIIFLGWGVIFHIFNALIMGLNSFLWAFLAAYPAIIFCVYELQSYS